MKNGLLFLLFWLANFHCFSQSNKASKQPFPASYTQTIINQILAHADSNNFLRQGAYNYNFYEKTKMDLKYVSEKENQVNDSTSENLRTLDDQSYLFLHEAYGKKSRLTKGKELVELEAVKQSGLKLVDEDYLINGLNHISLYENNLMLFGERFYSPLGNSFNQYQFELEKIHQSDEDSIFQIAFYPSSEINHRALSGKLYVHSQDFSITQMSFQYDGELRTLSYHQQLIYFEEKGKWYPAQESYEMLLKKYPKKDVATSILKTSFYSNVNFDSDTLSKQQSLNVFLFDNYNNENEDFWRLKRGEKLTERERLSYVAEYKDYNGSNLKKWYKIGKAFYKNELAFNYVGIDLNNLFRINSYEAFRLGLGASTPKGLLGDFTLRAYGAYGFRDQDWKYGGGINYLIGGANNLSIGFSYQSDLEEPGRNEYLTTDQSFFRRLFTSRMDILRKGSVDLTGKLNQWLDFQIEGSSYSKEATYAYAYQSEAALSENPSKLQFTEISFSGKYSPTEYEVFGNFSYPSVYFKYSRGLDMFLDGGYNYNRVSGKVDFNIFFSYLGESTITVEAGIVEADNPYPILFNGRGGRNSLGQSSGIFIKDAFQTMDLYGFASNEFTNLFFTHNFKRFGSRNGKFKPELGFAFNAGWGKFNGNKTDHQGITFQDYSEGFYETGLLLNNLLKTRILGLVKGGVGLAFYYTVGPYAADNFTDNASVRFTYVLKSI